MALRGEVLLGSAAGDDVGDIALDQVDLLQLQDTPGDRGGIDPLVGGLAVDRHLRQADRLVVGELLLQVRLARLVVLIEGHGGGGQLLQDDIDRGRDRAGGGGRLESDLRARRLDLGPVVRDR